MAKLLNSAFGQLSGKLGGQVFSRNKSGAIVRSNTKGSNPKTSVQTKARALFASITGQFRQLTSAEKTSWQEFADNYYKPRNGTNTGQFSAYNAFMALRGAVQQAYRLLQTFSFTLNGSALTGGTTDVVFTPMPETPLAQSFVGAFTDTNAQAVGLTINSGIVNADGTGEVEFQVGDGSGIDLSALADPQGSQIGIALYLSNGNPSANMSYRNRFSNCLGYINPISATGGATDLTAAQTVKWAWTDPYDIGKAKRFPLLGEYALLSVFAVNKYGQFSEIDNVEVQIS